MSKEELLLNRNRFVKFTVDKYEKAQGKLPEQQRKNFDYDYCKKELKEVLLPKSYVDDENKSINFLTIDKELCQEFKKLEKVVFEEPTKISKIGEKCFKNCINLKDIKLPQSMQDIGVSAFEGCTSLKVLEIPDSVTGIGRNAFRGVEVIYYSGSAEDNDGKHWGAKYLRRNKDSAGQDLISESLQNGIDDYNRQGQQALQKSKQDMQSYKDKEAEQRKLDAQNLEAQINNKFKEATEEAEISGLSGKLSSEQPEVNPVVAENKSVEYEINPEKDGNNGQDDNSDEVVLAQLYEDRDNFQKQLVDITNKLKALEKENSQLKEEKKDLESKLEKEKNKKSVNVDFFGKQKDEQIKRLNAQLDDFLYKYKLDKPEIKDNNIEDKLQYFIDYTKKIGKNYNILKDLFENFLQKHIKPEVLANKSFAEAIGLISQNIDRLDADRNRFMQIATGQDKAVTQFTEENEKLQNEKIELQAKISNLEKANKELEEQVKVCEELVNSSQKKEEEYKKAKEEHEKKRKEYLRSFNVEDFINAYDTAKFEDLKVDKERLDKEVKELKEKLNNLNVDKKTADETCKSLEIKNIQLESGKKNYLEKIKELQAKVDTASTYEVLVAKNSSEIERLKKDKTDLNSKLGLKEVDVIKLTQEKGKLEGQLDSKLGEIEQLEKKNKQYFAQITQYLQEVQKVKSEKEALERQLGERNEESESLTLKLEDKEAVINNLTEEKSTLQGQLTEKDNQIDNLKLENKEKQDKIVALTSDKEIAVEREKELTKQKKDIEVKRDTLIEEKNNIKQKADDFEKKYKDKRDELDRVNDELKNINKELEKYKKQAGEAEKNLKFKEAEFEKINEAYADFDELSNAYNALSDAVKSDCKLIFGVSDNIASIILNLSEKFNKFWDTLSNKVNEDKTSKEDIENLKKIFDISFTFMKLYDNRFERLKTKKGDRFDPSTMNKWQSATQVQVVDEVLLLGYTKLNITKKSLVR